MKYYYNNQLIRTSKNHVYSHAVVYKKENGDIAVVGCRRTFEEAEALKRAELNGYLRGIENDHKAIKALQSGKNGYFAKEGRKDYWIKFDTMRTVEYYENDIKNRENIVKNIERTWQIIELEAR